MSSERSTRVKESNRFINVTLATHFPSRLAARHRRRDAANMKNQVDSFIFR